MTQTVADTICWTTADLELLPEGDGRRYEIIDGDLHVTRAPHWKHQSVCGRIYAALDDWSLDTGLGEASITPGIVFADADNVIPDVVWASNERLMDSLDDAGHLTAAPELVVEVLSPGEKNERRDRDLKLRLYSARGVREYWIISRPLQQIEIYRRDAGVLVLTQTVLAGDCLTTPLLPGFSYVLDRLFR
jgi:Uma2 family endonuclease